MSKQGLKGGAATKIFKRGGLNHNTLGVLFEKGGPFLKWGEAETPLKTMR